MLTSKQKLDSIVGMVEVFKEKHNTTNQNLVDFNEGKHCSSFDTIKVRDIEIYLYDLLLEQAKGAL